MSILENERVKKEYFQTMQTLDRSIKMHKLYVTENKISATDDDDECANEANYLDTLLKIQSINNKNITLEDRSELIFDGKAIQAIRIRLIKYSIINIKP